MTAVHGEIAGRRDDRVIGTVAEANVRTTGQRGLCKLKMDAVCALDACIMIKTDDKSVGCVIR